MSTLLIDFDVAGTLNFYLPRLTYRINFYLWIKLTSVNLLKILWQTLTVIAPWSLKSLIQFFFFKLAFLSTSLIYFFKGEGKSWLNNTIQEWTFSLSTP